MKALKKLVAYFHSNKIACMLKQTCVSTSSGSSTHTNIFPMKRFQGSTGSSQSKVGVTREPGAANTGSQSTPPAKDLASEVAKSPSSPGSGFRSRQDGLDRYLKGFSRTWRSSRRTLSSSDMAKLYAERKMVETV